MAKKTDVLLNIIYGACDLIDSLTITRGDLWNVINGGDYDRNWSRRKFTQTLHNLNNSGFIDLAGNSVQFTDKAKIRIIDQIAKNIDEDSSFRFISFDIPESMRAQRNAFRKAIARLGFKQVQKSLWAINKNVGELVELAAYEYGVGQYIVYIASNKSDIDGLLEKKFKPEPAKENY